MSEDQRRIPPEEWYTIVSRVPIVSVDLVVRHDGGLLLGRRINKPAEGEWFVPGGRLHKNERLESAVHRIADEELGVSVEIKRCLGVYEHIYDQSEFNQQNEPLGETGKHYVPVGYLVEMTEGTLQADHQHETLEVFYPPFDPNDFHEYVLQYAYDAGLG